MSYGLNYQKTGKELMSRDELAVMDGNKCILQLRGVRPFYSDKFDITKHKRYKQLSDYDKKNEFHVEEYMKHQMEVRLSPEEAFDLYVYEGGELEKQSNRKNIHSSFFMPFWEVAICVSMKDRPSGRNPPSSNR